MREIDDARESVLSPGTAGIANAGFSRVHVEIDV
jgi:hypothetical protein